MVDHNQLGHLSSMVLSTLKSAPVWTVIGFFAKSGVDAITKKPRLRFQTRDIVLDRLFVFNDDERYRHLTSRDPISVELKDANTMRINVTLIISNIGKSNTAISDILLKIRKVDQVNYFEPSCTLDNEDNLRAFNMEASSCKVVNLNLELNKDENSEFYFESEDLIEIEIIIKNFKGNEEILKQDIGGSWTFLSNYPYNSNNN